MGVTRKVLNWYARMSPSRGKLSPPYEHVVQIGDPRLRKVSEPVPLDKIKTEEVQKVIHKLRHVLDKYGSVGMSAPQVGVNMRMFVMRHTAKQISALSPEIIKSKGMSVVPFTVSKYHTVFFKIICLLVWFVIIIFFQVFINPKLKVVDYQKIVYMEGCESVQGYSAEVPRYREVEVTGNKE